ncbi:uncharacterized protein [Nicotiana sylvestris]|uniref:Uncharacterized protein LOC104230244 n=1 Tax=Nicotiana sylvestris TaxID=4096 RepID=A0A1U7X358_NICSY|nr:PREDICTED: uncharacterized protein LOC104230244 [Nicotiana sylvestris]
MGYAGHSASTSVNNIELMALLRGLKMAFTHNLTPLQIHMDAKEVINLINTNYSLKSAIAFDCSFHIHQLNNPPLSHTYRDQNIVADKLAHFGMELEGTPITFFADPPHFIWKDLLNDKYGVGTTRWIPRSKTFCMDSLPSSGTQNAALSTS